jgi:Ca2+-transporting ATPase
VIGFATRHTSSQPKTVAAAESELIFVGLQAMMDPPRAEVAEVIERVQKEAGMRVVMITGDHIDTAQAIARELNITGDALTGTELAVLSEAEFLEKVETTSVYARVNPEHKIRIVQALKKNGHQVAMTGDGVNDAPAIKAADIGIAMGITGTDVTKEAADLILLDDQFLTIISAIEEGRGIFDNVRKFVNFLLSANIAEVITILAGIIFARKLLLSPSQLLFINIVTDGLPAIALGSDPAARNIMKTPSTKISVGNYKSAHLGRNSRLRYFDDSGLLLLYARVPAYYSGAIVFAGMVIFEMVTSD